MPCSDRKPRFHVFLTLYKSKCEDGTGRVNHESVVDISLFGAWFCFSPSYDKCMPQQKPPDPTITSGPGVNLLDDRRLRRQLQCFARGPDGQTKQAL